jgi:hypothetical protein
MNKNVKLQPHIHEQLKILAKHNRRTMSSLVQEWTEQHYADYQNRFPDRLPSITTWDCSKDNSLEDIIETKINKILEKRGIK